MADLPVREYGQGDRTLVVLHGGPAAAGDAGPLARELGARWRVLEPLQRGSGLRPLTVARHVEDLHAIVTRRCSDPPAVVGHSWGAMLALAWAAAHPSSVAALVLVGCGTFSATSRAEFERRLHARLRPDDRDTLAAIERDEPDPDRRLAAIGRLMTRVYGHDVAIDDGPVSFDARAHEETWADMLRLQREGVYPAAFSAIRCPVLMVHGADDPHPGQLTRDDLSGAVPQLAYRELARCGHSPWLERHARDALFEVLNGWLEANL